MRKEPEMIRRFPLVALAALGYVQFQATGQTPPASADPYANNPDAGNCNFRSRRRPARTPAQLRKRFPVVSIRE
jgi:hypothetical protein